MSDPIVVSNPSNASTMATQAQQSISERLAQFASFHQVQVAGVGHQQAPEQSQDPFSG